MKAFESRVFDIAAKLDKPADDTPQNKNEMTLQEFLASEPKLYAQIMAMGVTEEKDRVCAWMEFNDVDSEAVKAGIDGGEKISQTDMAKFNKISATLTVVDKDDKGGDGDDKGDNKDDKGGETPEAIAAKLKAEAEKTANLGTDKSKDKDEPENKALTDFFGLFCS